MKQSAAWQTWDPSKLKRAREEQRDPELPPKPGPGIFDIGLRTGWFDDAGAVWTKLPQRGRPAHVYVFAWNGQYGDAADHRDPQQWMFFIVPTESLPKKQKTLRLAWLQDSKNSNCVAGPFSGPERLANELARRLAPENRP